MKYKIGDKVRIRSKEWYDKHKDECGNIRGAFFDKARVRFCGTIQTIASDGYITSSGIIIYPIEDAYEFIGEEAIEGLAEKDTLTLSGKEFIASLGNIELPTGSVYVWDLPEGYEFQDENGNVINATKIVLEKKKKEYPKTYEECLNVLAFVRPEFTIEVLDEHYERLISSLYKLLICRDAYWKIAGEEMGLGKPWEPDWNSLEPKYVISISKNSVKLIWEQYYHRVFAFPTAEMRDAFYENFKEEIEQCKELL